MQDDLISLANDYFNSTLLSSNLQFCIVNGVTANPRQLLKKSPLWSDAYVNRTAKHGDVVIVPHKFDKSLSLKSTSPNEPDISIDQLSNLFIYKNASGYHAEVVTAFPDKSFSEPETLSFSGVVLVEDWAGNSINKYLFRNGRAYSFGQAASNSTSNRLQSYCYYRNWYLCSVDEFGNPYDCEYEYTELIGCYEEILYDHFYNETGAGDYSYDEMEYIGSADLTQQVLTIGVGDGDGECVTKHKLYAKFRPNHPEHDRFRSCYFIRSDVNGNTNGGTSSISTHNVVGLNTANITITIGGTVSFPNNTYIPFNSTQSYELGNFGWGH